LKKRHSSAKQPDINDILIEGARRRLRVVRLKGGDPLVFGRVQQEMAALQAAGVPCVNQLWCVLTSSFVAQMLCYSPKHTLAEISMFVLA
jgi:siroheme synthase